MNRFSVVLASAVLTFGSSAVGAQNYATDLHNGCEALETGNLPLAQIVLTRAIQARPQSANCEYALACVAARKGALEPALALLTKAVDHGWLDAAVAEWDSDLAALREGAEFQALLARMRMNAAALKDGAPRSTEIVNDVGATNPDWSSDGEHFLARRDGDVLVWDASSGELVSVIRASQLRVSQAEFTPDGKGIVTVADDEILRLWDVASASRRSSVRCGRVGLPLSFSADGRRVMTAGIGQEHTSVFDVENNREIASLARDTCLARLSPNGTRALLVKDERASGGSVSVILADVDSAKTLLDLGNLGIPTYDGGFSVDGKRAFVSSMENGVTLIDVEGSKLLRTLREPDSKLMPISFLDAGGTLLTNDAHGNLQWWSTESGTKTELHLALDNAGTNWWFTRIVSPDESLLYLTSTETSAVIDLRTRTLLWRKSRLGDHVSGAAFSADGARLAIGDFTQGLIILDARTGQSSSRFVTPFSPHCALSPEAVASMREGRVPIGCSDGSVRLLSTVSCREVQSFQAHDGAVDCAEYSPDGRFIATASRDTTARIFDARNGKLVRSLEAYVADPKSTWPRRAIAFSADGERLLTWGRGPQAILWRVADGSKIAEFDSKGEVTNLACFNADGSRLATSDAQGNVSLWDGASGKHLFGPFVQHLGVESLAISADGRRVAIGGRDAIARLWTPGDPEQRLELSHKDEDAFGDLKIGSVTFSADGAHLLSTSYSFWEVRSWNVTTGAREWTMGWGGGSPAPIHALYAPDATHIYAGFRARVVDAKDGKVLHDLGDLGLRRPIPTPDGKHIVTTRERGDLVLLDAQTLEQIFTWRPASRTDRSKAAASLVTSPSLYFDGPLEGLRRAQLLVDGKSYPLDCYATRLLDPKRVRARAAGIEVLRPALAELPRITRFEPPTRTLVCTGETAAVQIEASATGSIERFEIERDGTLLTPADLAKWSHSSTGKPESWIKLELPRPKRRPSELRIVAIDASGNASLPKLLTILPGATK